mgnify:CR=1 FL=1
MMKMLYLIPPSEWKILWWIIWSEKLSFQFEKPLDILATVTEKDLKCSGKRLEEAQALHAKIITHERLELLPAIERYSGVMYNAIGYDSMNWDEKSYFDTHFFITSGLYGLLSPQDLIANYKLPVEAQWVTRYWKDILPQALNKLDIDIIIDLLPGSYKKMIDWKQVKAHRVEIEFLISKNGKVQKLAHGVKKVKGEYIKNICIEKYTDIKDVPWKYKAHSEKYSVISIFSL